MIKIFNKVALAASALLFCFMLFSASALAAKGGDPCTPGQPVPKGFACDDCTGDAQVASCCLRSLSDPNAPSCTGTITAPDQLCTLQTGNPFFGFPHWWEYLKGHIVEDSITGKQCVPTLHSITDIWAIVLAIIDMLLRLAGLAAVLSIIFSGAQYMFAGGNPEKAAASRWRLYNSLIGLAIVAVATGVVAFVGNYIK